MAIEKDSEIWKQIIVDEIATDYEISNLGRVRNIRTGRMLKLVRNESGFLKVNAMYLGRNKQHIRAQLYIHRLVAEYFIPNNAPASKKYVLHKNHNYDDNRVENLYWSDVNEHTFIRKEWLKHCVKVMESIILNDSMEKMIESIKPKEVTKKDFEGFVMSMKRIYNRKKKKGYSDKKIIEDVIMARHRPRKRKKND
jgi:hypothetical protein